MRSVGMYGGSGLIMINWNIIGIILMTILVWYCVFKYGFFTTVIWLVIGSCILGLILKLKEETRV